MSLRAGVVTFPGSNCDDDCRYALRLVGFEVESIWHKEDASLERFSLVVLPGGFSYGDYLRAGAIAAQSPVMQRVKEFAESGGYVLGICNGFQILCESRLLPGALVRNRDLRFICREITLSVEKSSPWTTAFQQGQKIVMPIAHGEGRFVPAEGDISDEQVLFRYCDSAYEGGNPNGSFGNIAGILNAKQNVLGLMPHPERATDLGSGHGKLILQSIANTLSSRGAV